MKGNEIKAITNIIICVATLYTVQSVTTQMNDVIQPRFDRLTSLQAEVAGTQLALVSGLDRISSNLDYVYARLARLDQPISLRIDPFIRLNNTESGISKLYNSLRLDFMLSAYETPFRYSAIKVSK